MSVIKINDGVYSVGVTNPALRVFDIIMYADYGTTYNAYLVKGEKTALIEIVHEDFFDEYLENIAAVADISKIEYLIVNHTEPDHTGSIIKLLKLNPNLQIYGTAAAGKCLAQIANMQLNFNVVKPGQQLDLGNGHILEFCPAPFLHWPDSMFTIDKGNDIAFTCDFLGTHYCEPCMFDTKVHYMDKYLSAFRYYYDCIFGPFKPYVLEGLKKLSNYNPKIVCPSHGPILTESISESMEKYESWSTPVEIPLKNFAIVYASCYGYTAALASAAADAIEATGMQVKLIDIVKASSEEAADALAKSDGFMIGTDTINRNAPKPIWDMLSFIDAINTSKPVGAFGSYGWSGEAVPMVKSRLEGLRFKFVDDGFKVLFRPTEDDLAAIQEYALSVAGSIK
ncbi:MAG: FprA family A-type flavoprotein [Oscillospiraceae bacterium]|nr:FprA family A-type flavoprotein [Oscillospiraceae bacterium]